MLQMQKKSRNVDRRRTREEKIAQHLERELCEK